jgi:hypothetical protein
MYVSIKLPKYNGASKFAIVKRISATGVPFVSYLYSNYTILEGEENEQNICNFDCCTIVNSHTDMGADRSRYKGWEGMVAASRFGEPVMG